MANNLPAVHSRTGSKSSSISPSASRELDLPGLPTRGPAGEGSDFPASNNNNNNNGGGGGAGGTGEPPATPRRRDVDAMPSFEIMEQLRRRNLVPSGFYADDKRTLQAIFDEAYEQQRVARQAYMATINASRKDNYTRQFVERKKRRDEMEVTTAVKKCPEVPVWLELVKAGTCNPCVGRAGWWVGCGLVVLAVGLVVVVGGGSRGGGGGDGGSSGGGDGRSSGGEMD
jgi:hypothetical protein